jgi:hypothetical protein
VRQTTIPILAAPPEANGHAPRRALVLHDRRLVVDLIELVLNHGLFVVRAAQSVAEAEAEAANVPAAQQALFHRANCNRAARRGEYSAAMENA